MHAIYSTNLILLDMTTLITSGDDSNYEVPQHVTFSFLDSNIPSIYVISLM